MAHRAVLGFLILLAAPRVAVACSCFLNPPCQAFWNADAVFTGVVTSVDYPSDRRPAQTHTETTFAVERGLRGADGSVVIRGDARNTINTCRFDFKAGERYIVFARREADGALTTNMCSGTKPLAEAAQDLKFATHLPKAGSGGRIFGEVKQSEPNLLNWSQSQVKPARGLTVTLTGAVGAERKLRTDQRGAFEAKRMKPGTYRIALNVPPTARGYFDRTEIEVKDRGCAIVNMAFETNGRIAGRVTDASGAPAGRTRIWAVPTTYTNKIDFPDANLPSSTAESDGRYEIGPLPPGDYYVAVNIEPAPTIGSADAPAFYPGVLTRAKATPITLKEGELRDGVDFALPRQLTVR
jgi:hypothetical protein